MLDADDAEFANFKMLVTNAGGALEAKTPNDLGITSIDLTADSTMIELQNNFMAKAA